MEGLGIGFEGLRYNAELATVMRLHTAGCMPEVNCTGQPQDVGRDISREPPNFETLQPTPFIKPYPKGPST